MRDFMLSNQKLVSILMSLFYCRSQLQNLQQSDDADVPESEFMKSFKVATFEFSVGSAKKEAADNTAQPHFWENVLQSKRLQLEAAEQERLGKGKRLRKKVRSLPEQRS